MTKDHDDSDDLDGSSSGGSGESGEEEVSTSHDGGEEEGGGETESESIEIGNDDDGSEEDSEGSEEESSETEGGESDESNSTVGNGSSPKSKGKTDDDVDMGNYQTDQSLSKREQRRQEKSQRHMRKRRVKRERREGEEVHGVVQKTTLGKYIYKLPMTPHQESMVEGFYNDYLDSDVLGYRKKKAEEEERQRLKKLEWEKRKEKYKRILTGPLRYVKQTYAGIKEWIRLYRKGMRKVTAKRLKRFIRFAALNNASMLRNYVKSGIPINYRDENGWTALHHGAFEGYTNVIRECIKFKSEIDPVDGKMGVTPFWMSVYRSDNRSGFMLVDAGCDVDHKCPNTEMTPLLLCAQNNNLNMAERLIDEGAFLTYADKGGWTPLHHAAWQGHVSMVFLLLENDHERGGARDMKDRAGNLPVDYALRQKIDKDCDGDYDLKENRIKCAKLLMWGIESDNEYLSDDDFKYW